MTLIASQDFFRLIIFFSEVCVDATIEEVHHAIHQFGHATAYPNIFGMKPTLVSTLQNLMDNAR